MTSGANPFAPGFCFGECGMDFWVLLIAVGFFAASFGLIGLLERLA
jgi:hypothetical protein